MAAHCSGCVFTVCVCVCVCVFTAVCVCTLDGLNAEHKFRVGYVTSLSLSVALYNLFIFLNESVLILIRLPRK